MELNLLNLYQITGDNKLKLFDEYNVAAKITDFAVLLGGTASDNYILHKKFNGKGRLGKWWTKTSSNDYNCIFTVNLYGSISLSNLDNRDNGIRLIVPYSSISSLSKTIKNNKSTKEVICGEYPQEIMDEVSSLILESAYENNKLTETGKKYITDSIDRSNTKERFNAKEHIEYEHKGKKYIRYISNFSYFNEQLSNGRKINEKEKYWLKVEPVKWLVDIENDIAITEKIIVAGIQFNYNDYDDNFENTDIYKYMNIYLVKDIFNNTNIENKEFKDINNKMKILRKRINNIKNN